jgi:hypothetical protein
LKSKNIMLLASIIALASITLSIVPVNAGRPAQFRGMGRPGTPIRITVQSTGLVFESIHVADPLPLTAGNAHTFQELLGTGPDALYTAYGPGDPEYRGGRWYIDDDGTTGLSEGDTRFSCPLLGPGVLPV